MLFSQLAPSSLALGEIENRFHLVIEKISDKMHGKYINFQSNRILIGFFVSQCVSFSYYDNL